MRVTRMTRPAMSYHGQRLTDSGFEATPSVIPGQASHPGWNWRIHAYRLISGTNRPEVPELGPHFQPGWNEIRPILSIRTCSFAGVSLRGGRPDSNRRPPGPQPGALPAELRPPRALNLAIPLGAMPVRRGIAFFRPEARPLAATPAQARGAVAIGALAVGAAAVGGFAIGRLSVGRLAIDRAAIRRLKVDELEIEKLRVRNEERPV
jgi:hypothetical protein